MNPVSSDQPSRVAGEGGRELCGGAFRLQHIYVCSGVSMYVLSVKYLEVGDLDPSFLSFGVTLGVLHEIFFKKHLKIKHPSFSASARLTLICFSQDGEDGGLQFSK